MRIRIQQVLELILSVFAQTRVRVLQVFSLVLLLVAFSPQAAQAQTTNATLSGQVADTSGAAIPGAEVVATNEATQVPYPTKTNRDGLYVLPNLPPGTYHTEITKDGFKRVMQPGIELHVEDSRAANYVLQVGTLSETVTVQAESFMINTQDATVSTTIDRNFAENLPLNGRSFQTLILLAPGTLLVSANPYSSGNGGSFSVNGQRANANSFTVDGVSANLGGYTAGYYGQASGSNPSFTSLGTTQGMVSVDALEEFKLQTSTYSPEFGRQPGGQVSLVSRSGTNEFHGTAFDYVRNDALDAGNWFNGYTNIPPIPKGKERQNDFGGTLGGPILKDKTFAFFSYEGLRLLQPYTSQQAVPSLRLRQEAAPTFQAILDSWPIPTGPEFTDSSGNFTGRAPYTFSGSNPSTIDSYGIKIDQSIGSSEHLFARYANTYSDSASVPQANELFHQKVTQRSFTLGLDSTLRPTLDNELRLTYGVGVSRFSITENEVGGGKAFDPTVLFPKPLVYGSDEVGWTLQLQNENTFFEVNPGPQQKFSQRQINVLDNMSYSVGLHSLKWGVDYRRLFPILAPAPLSASYTITSEGDLTNSHVSQLFSSSSLVAHPIYVNFSSYAQDTWRVTTRLSLTYGLRWELNPPPGERDGIQPLNILGLTNPPTATLAPTNSHLYKTTFGDFAPRLGVAYEIRQSPGRETVLRTGVGLYYDLNSETTALGFGSAPFLNRSRTFTDVPFSHVTTVLPVPPVPTPLIPPYNYVYAVDPNLRLPYTLQWNLSIEQGLGRNQSLTVTYVGSAGYRLLRSDELFDFTQSFQQVYAVRNSASSNYQSLQLQFLRRLSRGLQCVASYTFSHSLDNASAAETSLAGSPSGTAFLDPNIDYGSSDFDLRHSFRAGVTYSLPSMGGTNKFARAVTGDWSIDAFAITQSGLPVNLIGGYYSLNDGLLVLRPNLVTGQPLYVYGAQCAAVNIQNGRPTPCPGGQGFNPSAFTAVPTDASGNPTQQQGNLGRNVLRGFGASQIDFALHRQFNLSERIKLQFRSEFFNIFNHPNFGTIDNFGGDGPGLFGLAQSTLNGSFGAGLNSLYAIGGPRSIQLALKLVF